MAFQQHRAARRPTRPEGPPAARAARWADYFQSTNSVFDTPLQADPDDIEGQILQQVVRTMHDNESATTENSTPFQFFLPCQYDPRSDSIRYSSQALFPTYDSDIPQPPQHPPPPPPPRRVAPPDRPPTPPPVARRPSPAGQDDERNRLRTNVLYHLKLLKRAIRNNNANLTASYGRSYTANHLLLFKHLFNLRKDELRDNGYIHFEQLVDPFVVTSCIRREVHNIRNINRPQPVEILSSRKQVVSYHLNQGNGDETGDLQPARNAYFCNNLISGWIKAVSRTQNYARFLALETVRGINGEGYFLNPWMHHDHPTTMHATFEGRNDLDNPMFWIIPLEDEVVLSVLDPDRPTEHQDITLQVGDALLVHYGTIHCTGPPLQWPTTANERLHVVSSSDPDDLCADTVGLILDINELHRVRPTDKELEDAGIDRTDPNVARYLRERRRPRRTGPREV